MVAAAGITSEAHDGPVAKSLWGWEPHVDARDVLQVSLFIPVSGPPFPSAWALHKNACSAVRELTASCCCMLCLLINSLHRMSGFKHVMGGVSLHLM